MRFKNASLLALTSFLCIQWDLVHLLHLNLPAPWQPLLPGLGIFGAAFMLSWAAELAQFEIPQALALVFVAMVATLPEYAVDMYFAWTAGKNPAYIAYAAANMTGGNRLLLGAGWAAVIFTGWLKFGHRSIRLEAEHRRELLALVLATLYSFVFALKKTFSWVDSIVLLAIFAFYVKSAAQGAHEEPELEGGPAGDLARLSQGPRRAWTLGLFGLAGYTIFAAAHPFAEGLLTTGRSLGVEEFLLVQWLAPLASEAPEFIVAILFALRRKPGAGFGTLVSSKVNQWTLLIGMIPLAYGLSAHHLQAMPLDIRQVEELFLTSAQSFFAIVLLADLDFSLADGTILFILFMTQFAFTHAAARIAYGVGYLILGIVMLTFNKRSRSGFREIFSGSRTE